MQCALITATSTGIATAVNAWLASHDNNGSGLSINYVTMSEGTIGSSSIKVLVFYDDTWVRLA